MMKHWKALAAAILVPLAVAACLFVPGKFQSSLTIRADRSFTYAYKGEVVAVDLSGMMTKAMGGFAEALANNSTDGEGADGNAAMPDLEPTAEEKAKKDEEYRAVAAQLAKEAGYRTVEYRGEGIFYVDYEISGKLTHNFVFPYNQDAAMAFPFVAVELRGKDTVRLKAPGFAKQDDSAGGMGASEEATAKLDGTFTLTTDAEIVSQNNEDGARTEGAMKTVTWKVSPLTQDAPMAVLRVVGM
jgi:hypothetical protein